MSRAATKWTCGICGQTIYWDELFTFMSNRTVVHFNCLKQKALANPKASVEDVQAALDSLETELKKIVEYKIRLGKVKDEDLKKALEGAEKDAEKNAGILTRQVERLANVI
jgi:hypothetical protein